MNPNTLLQPTLEDELVLIRPLMESDIEPLYQVAKDSLIWEQHPFFDRYKRNVFVDFFKDSLESKGALIVIGKEDGNVIGSSRFKRINEIDNAIEIGWSFLSRSFWGGTYNKAVKTLMINHAFAYLDEVIFYIGRDNIRSQKAIEKMGAIRLDEPDQLLAKFKYNENFTYVITKANWV